MGDLYRSCQMAPQCKRHVVITHMPTGLDKTYNDKVLKSLMIIIMYASYVRTYMYTYATGIFSECVCCITF